MHFVQRLFGAAGTGDVGAVRSLLNWPAGIVGGLFNWENEVRETLAFTLLLLPLLLMVLLPFESFP
jgi:hypothetical protein